MLASEKVMHQSFYNIVAEYHPFAEYLGYQELPDGFVIYYEGSNGQQRMLVDVDGNIVDDTTLGTTRTVSLLAVGAALLSSLIGDY